MYDRQFGGWLPGDEFPVPERSAPLHLALGQALLVMKELRHTVKFKKQRDKLDRAILAATKALGAK